MNQANKRIMTLNKSKNSSFREHSGELWLLLGELSGSCSAVCTDSSSGAGRNKEAEGGILCLAGCSQPLQDLRDGCCFTGTALAFCAGAEAFQWLISACLCVGVQALHGLAFHKQ